MGSLANMDRFRAKPKRPVKRHMVASAEAQHCAACGSALDPSKYHDCGEQLAIDVNRLLCPVVGRCAACDCGREASPTPAPKRRATGRTAGRKAGAP